MCFLKPNSQCVIITSDNGLAPNGQQAVIWTSAVIAEDTDAHKQTSLGLSELSPR